MQYQETLKQSGLSASQAEVYEALLTYGEQGAGALTKKTSLKRGLVYKALEDLVKFGLVDKVEEAGKVARFVPKHPTHLRELVESRQKALKDAELVLDGLLPSLVSEFNLVSGKPGVLVYEGLEGVKKVLEDTLVNNKEQKIFAFSDVAGYATYLKEWNTDYYAPKRLRLGIQEKVIIPNNEKALEYMKGYKASEVTQVLFIDRTQYPFKTEVNIYSGKVSFVTFSEKGHIGVIVENQEIYNTLVSVFKFTWALGQKYCQELQPQWTEEFGG